MSTSVQISEAQLAANKANAQLSTGPRSEAAKSKVSLNAVKTALTGRNIFLPTDDAKQYQQLLDKYLAEYQPIGVEETAVLQSIVDTLWRLERIPNLEAQLYNSGLKKLCEERPELTGATIQGNELDIELMFEKQFRNLRLQDSRLSRRLDKDRHFLAALQQKRTEDEEVEMRHAAKLRLKAESLKKHFDCAAHGFAFSKERFDKYFLKLTTSERTKLTLEAFARSNDPSI